VLREVLVIHGGAGRFRPSILEERVAIEEALRSALYDGMSALSSGNALDAVEAAVKSMEGSGVFNAGKGASLNLLGEQALDASVMFGRDLSFGAVASLKYTWNAVSLARKVMERTDHVFLVGYGADKLAEALGFERTPPPPPRLLERYRELLEKARSLGYDLWKRNFEIARLFLPDTVGAVALDRDGNLAAATSTGGLWLKLPGRVGDTPLPGAGVYAENGVVAVSATGIGELIARYLAAARVAFKVKSGVSVEQAVRDVVHEVTRLFSEENTIGLIALDAAGNIGIHSNCEIFLRGYTFKGGEPRVALLGSEEPH